MNDTPVRIHDLTSSFQQSTATMHHAHPLSPPRSAWRTVIRALSAFALTWLCVVGSTAQAAIPASERAALLDLYTSTNGATWTNNTGWNGAAGTECTWFGVTCDGTESFVRNINLPNNALSGSLPASIAQLRQMERFDVASNQLTGSIPALTGMTGLRFFDVSRNRLDGTIGSLNGLPGLSFFSAHNNRLTGSLPPLAGITSLVQFQVARNRLTGTIPPLPLNMVQIELSNNAFTGNLPSLAGQTQLNRFIASGNRFTGTIPSLAGLSQLVAFDVSNNQLTGAVPPVPTPNILVPGNSYLCPNALTVSVDPAWDNATQAFPWSRDCSVSYTITPVPSANGTIFPDTPQLVGSQFGVPFSLQPDPGYGVVVGGTCAGVLDQSPGNIVFNAQPGRTCTVAPTFSNAQFNVNVTVTGIGNVTPVGIQSVLFGSIVSITATTNNPATPPIVTTTCGNGAVQPQGAGRFAVVSQITANCAVNVVFGPAFTVTPSQSLNGFFDPEDPVLVPLNGQTSFTLSPDPGYRINTVSGCGGTLAGNIYTTGPITANCTVNATFVLIGTTPNATQSVPTLTGQSLAALIGLLLIPAAARFRRPSQRQRNS